MKNKAAKVANHLPFHILEDLLFLSKGELVQKLVFSFSFVKIEEVLSRIRFKLEVKLPKIFFLAHHYQFHLYVKESGIYQEEYAKASLFPVLY